MLAVIYCEQNLLFVHPDHLCFDRTTYDKINGPGGPFMFDIIVRPDHLCTRTKYFVTAIGTIFANPVTYIATLAI